LPLVWPGGTYNNNGVTQGSIQITTASQMPVLTQIQVLPVKLLHFCNNSSSRFWVEENIDLFAKDKLPQVFKASIAVDQNTVRFCFNFRDYI
jgi:hypothetical protein